LAAADNKPAGHRYLHSAILPTRPDHPLKENPNLGIIVESHKFSTNGNAENDLEITKKRANAVVDWLVAHGVTAGRLQSKALGRTKPLTENDTPIEIQRNERIALSKAGS